MSIPVSPDPVQHPAWCELAQCTVTGVDGQGAHVGKVRTILAGDVMVSVRLYEGAPIVPYPDSDETMILVEIDDPYAPELNVGWPMRIPAAREFAMVVRALTRVAVTDHRPNPGRFGAS